MIKLLNMVKLELNEEMIIMIKNVNHKTLKTIGKIVEIARFLTQI